MRNQRTTRRRTLSVSAAKSDWVIARAGRNAGGRSHVGTKTPSVAHAWRCTWRLRADPQRCRKETAPSRRRAMLGLSPARVGPAAVQCSRSISSMKILVRAATALGRSARKQRNRFGTEITHCRTGTGRMTWSTRCAPPDSRASLRGALRRPCRAASSLVGAACSGGNSQCRRAGGLWTASATQSARRPWAHRDMDGMSVRPYTSAATMPMRATLTRAPWAAGPAGTGKTWPSRAGPRPACSPTGRARARERSSIRPAPARRCGMPVRRAAWPWPPISGISQRPPTTPAPPSSRTGASS